MTEFGFKIVGKDGKVVEDLTFDNYDQIADYMLEMADDWYAGLRNPEDSISIERRENGQVVFEDKSSFEASIEDGLLHDDGPKTGESPTENTGV